MKKLLLLFAAILVTFATFAQITANTGQGNWNSTTTWVGGVVPTAGDYVVIPDGSDVTIQSATDAEAFEIVIGEGNTGTLTILGSLTLLPGEVTSANGRIWMDRNLGASRVATSSTDNQAYGFLYQWGRAAEGHQSRNSPTYNGAFQGLPSTATQSGDWDGHFILVSDQNPTTHDWLSPQNDNLWQGVSGTNNPCPSGYRLPTKAEWETERLSWSSNNAAGAWASPLKLSMAGARGAVNGYLLERGVFGFYWANTVDGTNSERLYFHDTDANMSSWWRADGHSVRCIKD